MELQVHENTYTAGSAGRTGDAAIADLDVDRCAVENFEECLRELQLLQRGSDRLLH